MLKRYLQFTKRNIRRTPIQALAASLVMFFTFFAIINFLIIAAGSQEILRYYEGKPQVIAFFKDGTTAQDIKAIENALTQTGKVTQTKYVSKEEALKIYQERNKNDPALLELVTASILPASLEISTQSPADLAPIAQMLQKEPVVQEVIAPEDVVSTLTSATTIVRIVGGSVVIFATVFATLVILMIIGFKIRLRRDEIEIMRLIGAHSSFIRSPFIYEGIFYGLVGAVSAWILSYLLLWYFTPFLEKYLGEINLLPVNPWFMLLLLATAIILALFIGGLGSIGAVRRYLKV